MISLGYEVGSGEEVSVPLGHTIITGQSQKSGKTTAFEAMAVRCAGTGTVGRHVDPTVIAFVTKRGETSFQPTSGIFPFTMLPYFVERTDWRFVSATLESAFGEKMKFERAWIVRACKGARTLADVRRRALELAESSKRSMDKDIYMLLGEYLGEVLPDIEALPASSSKFLVGRGVNVMNLVEWRPKMQMLFIASVLDKVAADQENTVVIVPESWEMLPERRNTPAKEPAIQIARKGAAVGNYLWADSQDTAAISKEIIRQSSVWLLGVQRESNEIRRTLAHIPAGLKKPKADDVARLELGQFFACTPDGVTKTYVRPAWMAVDDAKKVAVGDLDVGTAVRVYNESVKDGLKKMVVYKHEVSSIYGKFGQGGRPKPDIEDLVTSLVAGLRDELVGRLDAQERKISEISLRVGLGAAPVPPPPEALRADWARLAALPDGERLSFMDPGRGPRQAVVKVMDEISSRSNRSKGDPKKPFTFERATEIALEHAPGLMKSMRIPYDTKGWSAMEEELYQKFKARLVSELRQEAPEILRVLAIKPELDVVVERKTVSLNGDSLRGRIALLIHAKFFDEPKENKVVMKELYRRGGTAGDARNYNRELTWLAENGFLTVEDDGYLAVKGMKINLKMVNLKEA